VCVWEGCRVCDQLVYSSDSLMVRQPVGVTGVNIGHLFIFGEMSFFAHFYWVICLLNEF